MILKFLHGDGVGGKGGHLYNRQTGIIETMVWGKMMERQSKYAVINAEEAKSHIDQVYADTGQSMRLWSFAEGAVVEYAPRPVNPAVENPDKTL